MTHMILSLRAELYASQNKVDGLRRQLGVARADAAAYMGASIVFALALIASIASHILRSAL